MHLNSYVRLLSLQDTNEAIEGAISQIKTIGAFLYTNFCDVDV